MIYRRELSGHHAEAADLIREAAHNQIALDIRDFRIADDQLTIDGMPAREWLDAMESS